MGMVRFTAGATPARTEHQTLSKSSGRPTSRPQIPAQKLTQRGVGDLFLSFLFYRLFPQLSAIDYQSSDSEISQPSSIAVAAASSHSPSLSPSLSRLPLNRELSTPGHTEFENCRLSWSLSTMVQSRPRGVALFGPSVDSHGSTALEPAVMCRSGNGCRFRRAGRYRRRYRGSWCII